MVGRWVPKRSVRRRHARLVVGAAALLGLTVGCGSEADTEPRLLLDLPAAAPGDIVGLVARDDLGQRSVEWINRLDGTIQRASLDSATIGDVDTIATIPVSTDGEQRGLLGQVVIDGRRFASWTQPDTFELVVGEVVHDAAADIVWSAGEAASGAIGGVLGELDGRILVGVGRNTGFDRDTDAGGAMLTLDPDGPTDQEPVEISLGYTNPWAFTTIGTDVWVADNAAGPDPDDERVDDVERLGRADLVADRSLMTRSTAAPRAPSSMVPLPDGRLGICGFLDNELRAYEIVDTDDGERSGLARAGTIMPCLTGATVFDDGTIVTASLGDPGMQLTILRP